MKSIELKIIGSNPELPTVALVATGGTIAQKIDPITKASVPSLSGEALLDLVPQILQLANIQLFNFSNIDSSQMTPELWLRLSKVVNELVLEPDIKGVVITHGTDTIAEAAYFLDLTMQSSKPVIFTGAMKSISETISDGPLNLYNAVLLAIADMAQDIGVVVQLNQYINSARYTRKIHTDNVQSFNSGDRGYLGYVAKNKIIKFRERDFNPYFPLPEVLPKVVLLKSYSGDDGIFIRYAVDIGVKGIVVEGFGAGNVDEQSHDAIVYALGKKIPVVIATQVPDGLVLPMYGSKGGGATLQSAGAIMANDISGIKARILLMLSLPYVDGDTESLRKYFS